MNFEEKVRKLLDERLSTWQAVNDDDPIHISGKDIVANACAEINRQENIAFAIKVLESMIYTSNNVSAEQFNESQSMAFTNQTIKAKIKELKAQLK